VVDLVHAIGDAIEGVDGGGHVAGDGQAATVGLGGDGTQDVGLDLGVDLDLLEVRIGVGVDGGDGLGGRLHIDVAEGERTTAVDQAGQEEMWSECVLVVDLVAEGGEELESPPHRGWW